MDLRAAIGEFLLDRESCGRKPMTLKFYDTNLRKMLLFIEGNGSADVASLNRSSLRAFFAAMHRRMHKGEIKQDTLAAYDRAVRTFCKFCVAEGWLECDPMKTRPRLRPAETLPDTWDLDEIECLLAICKDDQIGIRDRAIMLLLLDTGLRAGELANLTLKCIKMDTDRGSIKVKAGGSKSRRDRVVPLWTETIIALRRWLAIRPTEAETVFVSFDGHRQLCIEPLTTGGLYQMMRRRVKEAGIERKGRLCHIWRHTFARNYVMAGGDLETLRRMLGHRSLETVRIYLSFRTEDIEEKHFALSPVRRLYEKNSPEHIVLGEFTEAAGQNG